MEDYLDGQQRIEVQRERDPLSVAKRIISFISKHDMSEVDWDDYSVVSARREIGRPYSWCHIKDCCIDAPFVSDNGLRYTTNITNKRILNEEYTKLDNKEKTLWIKFLKDNGAFWRISVKRIDRYTSYATGFDFDYEIYNLKEFLELKELTLSRYIWETLSTEDGWSINFERKGRKLNRNYPAHYDTSSVLSILQTTKWVPDRDGVYCTPRAVSESTIHSDFVIDWRNGFLKAVGFGEEAKRIEEAKRAEQEREYLEQEQQKEAARSLGFESADEVISAKEDSKKIQRLRDLGYDPDELISEGEKRKKEKDRKSIDDMMNSREDEPFVEGQTSGYDTAAVVSNPERRRGKLEEELDEDPPETKKKVSVRKVAQSNKEEKQFLYNQYGGECQVCSKKIVKKDGSFYFEAINLMDTSVLEERFLVGLKVGWNSLCLCPNCAAEYKYGAVSLYDFRDKVKDITIDRSIDDYILFSIRMQGEERQLRYSPVHLFNLQTALNKFSNPDAIDEITDDADDIKTTGLTSPTTIKRIVKGDNCPNCGKKNSHPDNIVVTDKTGRSSTIRAVQCDCGAVYLTKKLYADLQNSKNFMIVTVDENDHVIKESSYQVTRKKPSAVLMKGNKYIVVKPENAKTSKPSRCEKCGMLAPIFHDDMCWECYSERQQSRYE